MSAFHATSEISRRLASKGWMPLHQTAPLRLVVIATVVIATAGFAQPPRGMNENGYVVGTEDNTPQLERGTTTAEEEAPSVPTSEPRQIVTAAMRRLAFTSASDASAVVGFPLRVPTVLPHSLAVGQIAVLEPDPSQPASSVVEMALVSESASASFMQGPHGAERPLVLGSNVEVSNAERGEMVVDEVAAVWSRGRWSVSSPTQEGAPVPANSDQLRLAWQKDGVDYMLIAWSGLTLDELVEIGNSLQQVVWHHEN